MSAAQKKSAAKKKKTAAKKQKTVKKGVSAKLVSFILAAAALVLFALFVIVSPEYTNGGVGVIFSYFVKLFAVLLGSGRFLLPFFLGFLAFAFYKKENENFRFYKITICSTALFLIIVTFFNIDQSFSAFGAFMSAAALGMGGGVIGGFFAFVLLKLFSEGISVVVLILLAIVDLIVLTNFSVINFLKNRKTAHSEKKAEKERLAQEKAEAAEAFAQSEDDYFEDVSEPPAPVQKQAAPEPQSKKMPAPGKKKRKTVHYADHDRIVVDGVIFTKEMPAEDFDGLSFREHLTGTSEVDDIAPVLDDTQDPDMGLVAGLEGGFGAEDISEEVFSPEKYDAHFYDDDFTGADDDTVTFEDIPAAAEPSSQPAKAKAEASPKKETKASEKDNIPELIPDKKPVMSHFYPPKTNILKKGQKANKRDNARRIKEGVAKLEKTLSSFGVQARVTDVVCGPSLIRYEVQPGAGVKVSKIVGLADDIALQLAVSDIRIAAVAGKSVIGIEVPRDESVTVHFRDILENSRFFEMSSKLTCAYGQDIAGNPVIGDLAKMPHLLIAGTTGSGKSVCMNTMICSILFKATPDQVKFIMIDPKQVEFVIYEGLPHLITPVVTDPKKAAGALKWALREMENRYTLFNQNRVRNLEGYNAIITNEADKLPQIVIFIDELADLMMICAKDVEASICRLAQKARAAGIHLVIATQRPSVDVITGLIKANIPSRIALSVSSQIDSRTILDTVGAEKLLGKGDMLYMPIGYSKPLRVQGAWLSDEECVAILDHYKKQGEPDYIEGVAQSVDTEQKQSEDFADPLFFDAARAVITAGQASTSMLQRRFRVGYNHAARIMEELQEKGIIGPADGAKPRQILMSLEAFQATFPEPREQSLFDES